jgi:hypothetical protein
VDALFSDRDLGLENNSNWLFEGNRYIAFWNEWHMISKGFNLEKSLERKCPIMKLYCHNLK